MKVKILYKTVKGSTKILADAIAAAVKAKAEAVPPINPCVNEKLIFIGCGVKKDFPYDEMVDYCNGLDNTKVKNAAVFCTSNKGDNKAEYILDTLRRKEINCVGVFTCPRPSLFSNKDRPNAQDIQDIQKWALDIADKVFDNSEKE